MTDKTMQGKIMTAIAASFSQTVDNEETNGEISISLINLAFYASCIQALQTLQLQRVSLQNQIQSGIITLVDATQENVMIKAKEAKIKKQLVNAVHVKSNGTTRSIKHHGPTSSYPKGYVYTKLEGGRLIKAKDQDSLYERLYSIYFGDIQPTVSVKVVFENAVEEKRITENPRDITLEKYKNDFSRFISKAFAAKDISEIDDIWIKSYTQDLVNSTPMEMSKKQYMAYKGVLNLIFNYATNHKIIAHNPVPSIKNSVYLKSCCTSRAKAEDKIFTPEEIDTLVEKCKNRVGTKKYGDYYINGYAMRFSVLTGVRVGELCALKWSDIDFDNGIIHIHAQQLIRKVDGHKDYYYVPYTKNERGISEEGRLFPLTDDIQDLLAEIRNKQKKHGIQSKFIFCNEDGGWIKTTGYETFLRRLCRSCGFQITNNHAFRMSLNSNVLVQNGIAVTDRAKLLGHSVTTNLNYYSFAQKDYIDKTRTILNSISAGKGKEPFSDQKEPFSVINFDRKKALKHLV